MKASSTPAPRSCVLVADGDESTRKTLSGHLTHWGYEAIVASEGEIALELAAAHSLGLALLDARMPDPSGMKLAGRLKKLQPRMETIIIAAHSSIQEAVEAMYRGAFYFLLKPLDLELLRERVDEAWAAYRERLQVQAGELVVDLQERRATRAGKPLRLTPLEYRLLACLARRQGEPVDHEVLRREAWGCTAGVDSNTIWIALHRLKRKIGPEHVCCIKGEGYLLRACEPQRIEAQRQELSVVVTAQT
jgi:DNA-binding response OmpR family regulator